MITMAKVKTFKRKESYNPNIPLDEDLKRGFKTAVKNGQIRMALEYLSEIVDILDDKFDESESPAPTEEKKAPSDTVAEKSDDADVSDNVDAPAPKKRTAARKDDKED